MNPNASIDSVLATMSKPQVQPSIKFSGNDIHAEDNVDTVVENRIRTLMTRKSVTQLDINLLEVLLAYRAGG